MTIEEMRSLDAEKTYKELLHERSEVFRLTAANLQLREGIETLKQRIGKLEIENFEWTTEVLRLTAANLQPREGCEELKQRIQRWHDILTPLMPSDLKSWHENNPSEWPEVTAWVITSQRERIHQLETENDALRADLLLWENGGPLP